VTCTRPAFALDRIEVLPDGRIAYLMKTARKGRTHRVMTAQAAAGGEAEAVRTDAGACGGSAIRHRRHRRFA
jgi:hypothetical protein